MQRVTTKKVKFTALPKTRGQGSALRPRSWGSRGRLRGQQDQRSNDPLRLGVTVLMVGCVCAMVLLLCHLGNSPSVLLTGLLLTEKGLRGSSFTEVDGSKDSVHSHPRVVYLYPNAESLLSSSNLTTVVKFPSSLMSLRDEASCVKELSRQCLTPNCLHKEQPSSSNSKGGTGGVVRVAWMAPPGHIADALFDVVQQALDSMYDRRDYDYERLRLVRTTHVPPYGYGGNHGWTKVIRIVTTPLTWSLVDTVSAMAPSLPVDQRLFSEENNDKNEMTTLLLEEDEVASTVLAQIVRFHNRLSHVAAHTSSLTFTLEELLEDPASVLLHLLNFVTHEAGYGSHGGGKRQTLRLSFLPKAPPNERVAVDTSTFSLAVDRVRHQVDVLYGGAQPQGLRRLRVLEDVLDQERRSTDSFQAWPCRSFWEAAQQQDSKTVSDSNRNNNDSPWLVRRLAESLVPDCHNLYQESNHQVRCTIPKDWCEVNQDAVCLKQQQGNKK